MDEFPICLGFFLRNTKEALTVFYSGRDDKIMDGIEFNDGTLFRDEITEVINKYSNDQLRVTYITDITSSGSVFNIDDVSNAVSFSIKKTGHRTKETKFTHGIFTYYFCKLTNDSPQITPSQLIEKMNSSLKRFNEEIICECADQELEKYPIFSIQEETKENQQ